MPSEFGILMSLITTSNNAPSSFRLAASPEVTVSTRWPSFRSVISSISHIERTSSHTRMLAMCHARLPNLRHRAGGPAGSSYPLSRRCHGFRDLEHEFSALVRHRLHRDACVVRLHDLVHDGQPEAG